MPPDSPDWLREIDHTGDIGIQVRADTLEQLFERAAEGMFWVLTDLDDIHENETISVQVEGSDLVALLVRWLSELNFRHTVDHQLYRTFSVEAIDDTEEGLTLTATARGEPIVPERHVVYTEIKAITFHEMDVHQDETGTWHVQVIFDM